MDINFDLVSSNIRICGINWIAVFSFKFAKEMEGIIGLGISVSTICFALIIVVSACVQVYFDPLKSDLQSRINNIFILDT